MSTSTGYSRQTTRRGTPWLALLACCAAVALVAPRAVWGDAVGSAARLDQAARLTIDGRRIELELALTLNRPAAFGEVIQIDRDADGRLSADEQRAYFARLARRVADGLELRIDGRPVPLQPAGQVELQMPFTKRYRFTAPQPIGWQRGAALELFNDNWLATPGRLTLQVVAGPQVDVVACSLPQAAPTESPAAANDDDGSRDVGLAELPEEQISERDVVVRYRAGSGRWLAGESSAKRAADVAPTAPLPAPRLPLLRLAALGLPLLVAAVVGLVGFVRWGVALGSLGVVAIAAAGPLLATTDRDRSADRLSAGEAEQVFRELHAGIYGAFEAPGEEAIYDALAERLDGRLLETTYEEVYRSHMRRQEDGLAVRIHRVRPLDTQVWPVQEDTAEKDTAEADAANGHTADEDAGDEHTADGDAVDTFRIRHRWRVYGTVSHFGHRHARLSEYEATYRLARRAGAWRITSMQIEAQRSVDPQAPLDRGT